MIAIFMAITIQIVLGFVLLNFTENNFRYMNIAKNTEDKVKAKYLALSGINFSILFLQIQKNSERVSQRS